MAKSKRNINAFQKAMLNNTKMIASDEDEIIPAKKEVKTNKPNDNNTSTLTIDKKTMEEFKLFAEKHQIPPEKIAELSIQMFMMFEDFWFKD